MMTGKAGGAPTGVLGASVRGSGAVEEEEESDEGDEGDEGEGGFDDFQDGDDGTSFITSAQLLGGGGGRSSSQRNAGASIFHC